MTRRRGWVLRWREQDGVSAVLVSLIVVFILIPVAAVSVDSSNLYSNRRQMQNAADAASQAGAEVMESVFQGAAQPSTLDTTVRDLASRDGSDTSSQYFACNVATVSYDPLTVTTGPSCADWTGDSTYNAVTVQTGHSENTILAQALPGGGTSSTKPWAKATATIQAVSDPDLGDAIFAACAYSSVGNGNNKTTDPSWIPMLVTVNGSTALNTGQLSDSGTPTAVGQKYVIWSNAGGNSNLSRCGLGSSSFDGLICGLVTPSCGQPITLPNWLQITTGAQVGPTLATMAGYPACDAATLTGSNKPSFTSCAMVLPVCDSSNGATGSNSQLHCVAFGEFLLSPGAQDKNDSSCTFVSGSSDTICGEFLGPPQPAQAKPTTGTPGPGDPYRVALVQ